MRRLAGFALLPLSVAAAVLAALPWLRAFRAADAAVPLIGAAVLSVGVAVLAAWVARGRLGLSALLDVGGFAVFTFVVVLHGAGVGEFVDGFVHGPAQILTVAPPLVSPRSLLVAPVALVWLAGGLAGECLGRRWHTLLPHAGFLVAFGLAYAATARAGGFGAGREVLLAAGLVLVLLLSRVAQLAVTAPDASADAGEGTARAVLRPLGVGAATSLAAVLVAALVAQAGAFGSSSAEVQRRPAVDLAQPLSPVAFVASLRPADPTDPGTPVFSVRTAAPSSGYFAFASVDAYDGAGWSFTRTFRPSGGMLPGASGAAVAGSVVQHYRIADGPLAGAPWLPLLDRAREVGGVPVNVDAGSGMLVPARALRPGDEYTVRSVQPRALFPALAPTAVPDTTTSVQDVQVPPIVRDKVARLVAVLSDELGVPSTPALPFLQALQQRLRDAYSLTGAPEPSTSPSGSPSGSPSTSPSVSPAPTAAEGGRRAGSAAFADVLASIGGAAHTGTPEQYATFVALIARQLGVPARVVAGFRVQPADGTAELAPGEYTVTTAEAWTWVQVPIAQAGWVVLDAAPGRYAGPRPRQSVGASASPLPTPTPSANPLRRADGGHAVAGPSDVPSSHRDTRALVITVLALGVLLILALLVALALRKPVRMHRRRRAAAPRARVLGAWQEGLDVLTEAGLSGLGPLTGTEVVAVTAQRFGTDAGARAGELAAVAGTALFSEQAVFTAPDAVNAWRNERALRRAVRRSLSRRGRLRAALRYHR